MTTVVHPPSCELNRTRPAYQSFEWFWTFCGGKQHVTSQHHAYHCDVVRTACGLQLLTEHPDEHVTICRDCERMTQAGLVVHRRTVQS